MYQAKLFENEFYREGIRHFGKSVHYHYVSENPADPEAQGGAKMVQSTMTEMLADVSQGPSQMEHQTRVHGMRAPKTKSTEATTS